MRFFLVKDQTTGFQKTVDRGGDPGMYWYNTISLDASLIPRNERCPTDLNYCRSLKDAVMKWVTKPPQNPTTYGLGLNGCFNIGGGEFGHHMRGSTTPSHTLASVNPVPASSSSSSGTSIVFINYQNRMRGYQVQEPQQPLALHRNHTIMSWKLFVTMTVNKANREGKMDLKIEGDLLDRLYEVLGHDVLLNLELKDLRPLQVPGERSQLIGMEQAGMFEMDDHENDHDKEYDSSLGSFIVEGLKINQNVPIGCFGTFCKKTGIDFPYCLLESWNLGSYFTGVFTLEVEVPIATDQIVKDRMKVNRKILEGEIATDMEIVAGNGMIFKCHRAFLCAQSPVFEAMFRSDMEESKTGRVTMSDVSAQGVKALLSYIYCWETEAAIHDLYLCLELLKVAHKYDIRDLENSLKHLILTRASDIFTLDFALELFMFARNLPLEHDLKMKAIQVFKLNVSHLDSCEKYNQLFIDNPIAAKELCKFAFSA